MSDSTLDTMLRMYAESIVSTQQYINNLSKQYSLYPGGEDEGESIDTEEWVDKLLADFRSQIQMSLVAEEAEAGLVVPGDDWEVRVQHVVSLWVEKNAAH